ncbi:hypothetical protein ABEB36_005577 [Hypothenemus hampei]|uniref:cysteine--tRNA ligase n=1 Tax=Hypothenemus hampei TaxID=57062 RepID=A0ABD1F1D4_HYPHA
MFTMFSQFYKKNLHVVSRFNHTWTLPIGHKTPINIYNCVTRKNESFIVKNKEAVTWYTCGPTVYDSSHVGHASCYVRLDIIQRILKHHFGLNLVTCMNITDIDDKIIKKAYEMKTDFRTLASTYEKEFWSDLAMLKIPMPDLVLSVTEHVPIIIDFIQQLEDKEVAYKAQDNSVYFDITKSPHKPGKLQNITDSPPEASNPFKKSKADFALWKSVKNENEPSFDSPWGKGRPGWHIECSALASLMFGSNIDIHAGGLDLRFPHHENEEIQSSSFHSNNQWVNYWIHTGHLHLKDSVKMSKSLKNTVSIQDMLKQTKTDVFRMACVKSRYSSAMEYSPDLLQTSSNTLDLYKNLFRSILDVKKGLIKPSLNNQVINELLTKSTIEIHEAFCDDFNTPQVLKCLDSVASTVNSIIYSSATSSTSKDIYLLLALNNLVSDTLNLFGIDLSDLSDSVKNEDFSEFMDILVGFRQDVRQIGLTNKDKNLLSLCDRLRDDLKKTGLIVKDYGKISSWNK